MKILLVAGARPNFMKTAPVIRALEKKAGHVLSYKLIHTGQHYDHDMSATFFRELEIPDPDYFLNAGGGTHSEQTAKIMVGFEKVCRLEKPDAVLVVGDVNSTLACGIVAKKLSITLVHVEAGLRSFDTTMPEEINRIVTDSITDWFFVTEESGVENLKNEGKPAERIFFAGNVMIDNLFYQKKRLERENTASFKTHALKNSLKDYFFVTLHRPANVDHRQTLQNIVDALNIIAEETPAVFPLHPRTRRKIEEFAINLSPRIHALPPLGFQEALFLWKDAELVLTDSGGLQEETTALGIPCLTLRNNTERPITVEQGTNVLAGNSTSGILDAYEKFKTGSGKRPKVPKLWDGKAAERIVDKLATVIYKYLN